VVVRIDWSVASYIPTRNVSPHSAHSTRSYPQHKKLASMKKKPFTCKSVTKDVGLSVQLDA